MIVKAEQIEALKPYIEDIEALVTLGDVQAVLDTIDDVIVDNILANNDEPDDEGIKLQKIYDEIFKYQKNNDLRNELDGHKGCHIKRTDIAFLMSVDQRSLIAP